MFQGIFILSISLSGCNRWFKPKPAKPTRFSIKIPLAEDYRVVSETLTNLIKYRLPNATSSIEDAISDNYVLHLLMNG